MTSSRKSIERIATTTDGPPPDFLRFRAGQMHLILELSQIDLHGKSVLEIGGGVSGHSSIMAKTADVVTCIDLLEPTTVYSGPNQFVWGQEMDSSDRFYFVFASAEQVPLQSSSVDVVFSSFVFEHIDDRKLAVQEIKRVLKPDGVVITNVPNIMEPIFRLLRYGVAVVPVQILKAVMAYARIDFLVERMRKPPPRRFRSLLRWLRQELALVPHGAYDSLVSEIMQSRPAVWDALFEKNGFRIVGRFAIAFESYGCFFRARPALRLQQWLRPFVLRYGRSRLARLMGTSYCVVATKKGATNLLSAVPGRHPNRSSAYS